MKNGFDWDWKKEGMELTDYLIVFAVIVGVMVLLLLILAGEIWIAQVIWNVCIVAIFPVAPIGYWQMWGVYLIARLLFGSIQYTSSKKD
jgi:hypothetical protein